MFRGDEYLDESRTLRGWVKRQALLLGTWMSDTLLASPATGAQDTSAWRPAWAGTTTYHLSERVPHDTAQARLREIRPPL